jgi:predicted nuclease with RNAse H fold/dephospho-CoA kinase
VRPVANQQSALALPDDLLPTPSGRIGKRLGPALRQRKARLKPADRRLFQALQDASNVVFLDIETTGLSRYYDEITIVGWLHKGCYQANVAGDDPGPLKATLAKAGVLVTFNGTLFDLPFLRKALPGIEFPPLHADLRYLAKRAGLTGGQKAIERELNLDIRNDIRDVDGAEAVLLWHRYLRGDTASLRRLIEYNRCDVLGMRYLLDEVLDRLIADPDFWFVPPRFARQPAVSGGWADPSAGLPCPSRLKRQRNTFVGLFGLTPAENATIVGIDLTGSEARPSGWCALRGQAAETIMIATDEEMVERVVAAKPALVSIDSPLSLPFGRIRVTDDDPGRAEFGIMRRCERELKRRGINVYPCLLPSMQRLTERGIRLATRLRRMGIPVIESYPGAAQDIMGIPRKGAGIEFLRQGLTDFGIGGAFATEAVTHDELDAITSALVGSFFLAGKFEALSGPTEDPLIIPHVEAEAGPIVVGVSGKVAAGKTTTAWLLEQRGFAYTRFSLVIDDEIRARGLTPDRTLRQMVGLELHHSKGQRWLAEKALARLGARELIVVDGLRFLEDHAFFVERFGSRFVHIHVAAPTEMRAARYFHEQPSGPQFADVERAPVESEIPQLITVAGAALENAGTIDQLAIAAQQALMDLLRRSNHECPSLSS